MPIAGQSVAPSDLAAAVEKTISLAAAKTKNLARRWEGMKGAPVFTVEGKYTLRGWTEWTQGFQFGNALIVHECTGDPWFLDYGKRKTIDSMAPHLTHTGVHDHGFNNVSTYGNLLRMAAEGKIEATGGELEFYRLALKVSGAVQASRWTSLPGRIGYIQSFNGPHSLFADTIRSLRALAIAHKLGQTLSAEQDEKVNLLSRLLQHAEATARWNVYFGKGRDRWDVAGRVAHESIFNVASGAYRCPSSQQGYSPFTTWTRGLAWVLLGFAEELEFLATLPESEFASLDLPYFPDKASVMARFVEVAKTVSDFYIENTPPDGIPYWDTGAPGLAKLGDYLSTPADPYNPHESVDSSAAAICAQGLLRLSAFLDAAGDKSAAKYRAAAATTAATLMAETYLSTDPSHEGLLLHAVYHYPNGWDHSADGSGLPRGESCMWGDYHLLELALYLRRTSGGQKAPCFFTI